jgi:hypothetical protein
MIRYPDSGPILSLAGSGRIGGKTASCARSIAYALGRDERKLHRDRDGAREWHVARIGRVFAARNALVGSLRLTIRIPEEYIARFVELAETVL